MPRFTVRVLKGDRLVICVNDGGADKVFPIKTAQAFRVAVMLNFRAATIEANAAAVERRRMRGI